MRVRLGELAALRAHGTPRGITSVCSAHPLVIRAALRHGRDSGATALIEATCNQVNHQGGYTGLTPNDFATLVHEIAEEENCPRDLIVLGGDHLGPNPWRHQPAETAMAEAEKMVEAYISAGFCKIHLDASMGCTGEPKALDDATTAQRAVRLASIAERVARERGGEMPRYIIGTEVPSPGGADHALDRITPTDPLAVRNTIAVHKKAFDDAGLSDAFARVIGLVVQPGVEFGNNNVIFYDRDHAKALIRTLDREPSIVFEAHSTDYQRVSPLSELVQDGFAILKVGPELTFVLREALYALDLIASDLVAGYGDRPLMRQMENLMLASPDNWSRHYAGDAAMQSVLRHYSLSDRIRYYWANSAAEEAVGRLVCALAGKTVPLPLFWQHMPAAARFAGVPLDAQEVLIWRVTESLKAYHKACNL